MSSRLVIFLATVVTVPLSADVGGRIGLSDSIKVALSKPTEPVPEKNHAQRIKSFDCVTFKFAQGMCEIVKEHLDTAKNEL